MSIPFTYGQDTGITGVTTGDLFSGGNVMLRKLMKRDYTEADGSPYLNDKFVKGKITFDNGKEYDILTRLNVGSQKFEIRKDLNSEVSLIEINESVTIEMENNEQMTRKEVLTLKLKTLKKEHRELDQKILTLIEIYPSDQFTLRLMKKRKLLLRFLEILEI